jgi:hypothetical protein
LLSYLTSFRFKYSLSLEGLLIYIGSRAGNLLGGLLFGLLDQLTAAVERRRALLLKASITFAARLSYSRFVFGKAVLISAR